MGCCRCLKCLVRCFREYRDLVYCLHLYCGVSCRDIDLNSTDSTECK